MSWTTVTITLKEPHHKFSWPGAGKIEFRGTEIILQEGDIDDTYFDLLEELFSGMHEMYHKIKYVTVNGEYDKIVYMQFNPNNPFVKYIKKLNPKNIKNNFEIFEHNFDPVKDNEKRNKLLENIYEYLQQTKSNTFLNLLLIIYFFQGNEYFNSSNKQSLFCENTFKCLFPLIKSHFELWAIRFGTGRLSLKQARLLKKLNPTILKNETKYLQYTISTNKINEIVFKTKKDMKDILELYINNKLAIHGKFSRDEDLVPFFFDDPKEMLHYDWDDFNGKVGFSLNIQNEKEKNLSFLMDVQKKEIICSGLGYFKKNIFFLHWEHTICSIIQPYIFSTELGNEKYFVVKPDEKEIFTKDDYSKEMLKILKQNAYLNNNKS